MATFVDQNGQRQQVNLAEQGVMYHFAMAQKNEMSFRQWINRNYKTEAGSPDAFSQMCMAAGLRFKKDEVTGIPPANLQEMLNPLAANQTGGTHTNYPHVPDSLILFPPAVLEAVNAALASDKASASAVFGQLLAKTDVIATDRWTQPVITRSGKKGPEDSSYRRTAQNAPPPLMLAITASDVTRTIPTMSIGMSISQKVLQNNSIDLIAETLTTFLTESEYANWIADLGLILSGDADATNTPMATAKSALAVVKASAYDSTIVVNGVVTQDAWTDYLYANYMTMRKTHIVADYAAIKAIDDREGRPTVMHNDGKDRIDTPMEIVYPFSSTDTVKAIVMPPGTWSANTIMGLDARKAIGRIISSAADYQATEEMLMTRTTNMRWDVGQLLYRLYDNAFGVLSLIA